MAKKSAHAEQPPPPGEEEPIRATDEQPLYPAPERAHQGTIPPSKPIVAEWFDETLGQAAAYLEQAGACVERAHALAPSTLPKELYLTWKQILAQERLELHRQDLRKRKAAET